MTTKTKVAILGGGCGAMAAAFELTRPPFRDRFDVTVYQVGWRLGGKCASGRDPAQGNRILEHGLHMLMGFYDDAFRVIRDCYAEWSPRPGHALPTFEDAFEKQHQVSFQERLPGNAGWRSWDVMVPARDGTPGDPAPASLTELLASFLGWLTERHERALAARRPWSGIRRPGLAHAEKALDVARGMHRDHRRVNPALFLRIAAWAERAAKEVHEWGTSSDAALHRELLALRLGYAALRGFASDVLVHDGDFSRIDHLEFRTWLMRHGALDADAWSAPIKALYDLGFAYAGGDATNPENAQAAAGVALYVTLQILFGCRGALLWKMKAGTGDTLFTPFYEVLRARGVRFEFFHRVDRLHLSADRTTVDRVALTRQVDLREGPYRPLGTVKYRGGPATLDSWPAEPFWDQIAGGDDVAERLRSRGLTLEQFWCEESAGRRELARGADFDVVLLGIPLGSLPHVCAELVEARPAWKSMIDGIPTVQTQSVQLWMKPTLGGLGWTAGPTVSISYVEPLDSWGEMSHLLPAEDWISDPPRSIHYLCGAMKTDPGPVTERPASFVADQQRAAEANARAFLDTAIGHLWPRAVDAGGFVWQRARSHYVRANVDPSERYVLSVPGSITRRLPPDCSTFANLYLAGDWVAGRVNSGCVEAAMSAGVRAAQAIQRLCLDAADVTAPRAAAAAARSPG